MGALVLPASGMVPADTQILVCSVERHPAHALGLRDAPELAVTILEDVLAS